MDTIIIHQSSDATSGLLEAVESYIGKSSVASLGEAADYVACILNPNAVDLVHAFHLGGDASPVDGLQVVHELVAANDHAIRVHDIGSGLIATRSLDAGRLKSFELAAWGMAESWPLTDGDAADGILCRALTGEDPDQMSPAFSWCRLAAAVFAEDGMACTSQGNLYPALDLDLRMAFEILLERSGRCWSDGITPDGSFVRFLDPELVVKAAKEFFFGVDRLSNRFALAKLARAVPCQPRSICAT